MSILQKFLGDLRNLLMDILHDERINEEVRNEYIQRLKKLG